MNTLLSEISDKINDDVQFKKYLVSILGSLFESMSDSRKEQFNRLLCETYEDQFGEPLNKNVQKKIEKENKKEQLTINQVEEWFQPPAKGGLSIGDLRLKGEQFGLQTNGLKKGEIKVLFENLLNDADTPDDEPEEDEKSIGELIARVQESETCAYTMTKGPRKGEKCSVKPKDGDEFCGKHKECKSAKSSKKASNTGSENDAEEPEEPQVCGYILVRGELKGTKCGESACTDMPFCKKHAKTAQAVDYLANKSPVAKAAAKKHSETAETSSTIQFYRNKNTGRWYVQSPDDDTVHFVVYKPVPGTKVIAREQVLEGDSFRETYVFTDAEKETISQLGLVL